MVERTGGVMVVLHKDSCMSWTAVSLEIEIGQQRKFSAQASSLAVVVDLV